MSENSPSASGSTAEGGGTRLPLQQVRPSGSQNSRRGDNPSSSPTPFLRVAKSIKPFPPLMTTGAGIRNATQPDVALMDPTAPNGALVAPSSTTDPNDDDTKMPVVPSTPRSASLRDMDSAGTTLDSDSDDDNPEYSQLSAYEKLRFKKIKRNKAKLRDLGLHSSPEPVKPKEVRKKRDRSLAPREKKEDARKSVPPEKFVSYQDLPNKGGSKKKLMKNAPPSSSIVGAPSYVPHGLDDDTSDLSLVDPAFGAISIMTESNVYPAFETDVAAFENIGVSSTANLFDPTSGTSFAPSLSNASFISAEADASKAGRGPRRAPSGEPSGSTGTFSATTSPPLLATPTPTESESRTLTEGGISRTWSNDAPLVATNANAMIAPQETKENVPPDDYSVFWMNEDDSCVSTCDSFTANHPVLNVPVGSVVQTVTTNRVGRVAETLYKSIGLNSGLSKSADRVGPAVGTWHASLGFNDWSTDVLDQAGPVAGTASADSVINAFWKSNVAASNLESAASLTTALNLSDGTPSVAAPSNNTVTDLLCKDATSHMAAAFAPFVVSFGSSNFSYSFNANERALTDVKFARLKDMLFSRHELVNKWLSQASEMNALMLLSMQQEWSSLNLLADPEGTNSCSAPSAFSFDPNESIANNAMYAWLVDSESSLKTKCKKLLLFEKKIGTVIAYLKQQQGGARPVPDAPSPDNHT